MAMIFCRECGNSISDKAKKCPHCGAASKTSSGMFSLPKVLLYILLIGVAWFVVMAIQVESKPTAESKGTRECNSEAAKEKAIELSKSTLLGKALGTHIVTFRSVESPLKDGEKLICKAVAVMSTGEDVDYVIKTELINGKQMIAISADDGSYDNLPKADIPQEAEPSPATQAAPPQPVAQPVAQPEQTPVPQQQATLEEQEPPEKPTWCPKAETTNEKLICETPELYAQSAKFEKQWQAYKKWHTDSEVSEKKDLMRKWNADVLQKATGVEGISSAYRDFTAQNNFLSDYPSITDGELYKSVREKLIAAGWMPYISPDAEECTGGTETCEGRYPETESCAGTGLGQCRFTWERDGKKIVVFTIGDDNKFAGMEESKLPEKPEAWYKATAKPALIVRSEPSQDAKKIGTVPEGGKVKLIDGNVKKESIGGNYGSWVKIEWQDGGGYVFDAFIEKMD